MKVGYSIYFDPMKAGYSIPLVPVKVGYYMQSDGRLFYTLMGMDVFYSKPLVPNR